MAGASRPLGSPRQPSPSGSSSAETTKANRSDGDYDFDEDLGDIGTPPRDYDSDATPEARPSSSFRPQPAAPQTDNDRASGSHARATQEAQTKDASTSDLADAACERCRKRSLHCDRALPSCSRCATLATRCKAYVSASVDRACEGCNVRKYRCDRIKPVCGSCTTLQVPCSWPTSRKPRGRPKKRASNAPSPSPKVRDASPSSSSSAGDAEDDDSSYEPGFDAPGIAMASRKRKRARKSVTLGPKQVIPTTTQQGKRRSTSKAKDRLSSDPARNTEQRTPSAVNAPAISTPSSSRLSAPSSSRLSAADDARMHRIEDRLATMEASLISLHSLMKDLVGRD